MPFFIKPAPQSVSDIVEPSEGASGVDSNFPGVATIAYDLDTKKYRFWKREETIGFRETFHHLII